MTISIYHTSPSKIEKIKESNGTSPFGNCFFFSQEVYSMCVGKTYVYSMQIEDNQVVSACDLHDEEIIEHIASVFECDEDDAEKLLDGRANEYDFAEAEDAGDLGYWLQRQRGECAKKMGFLACRDEDEQGEVFIIPMLGLENMLKLEEING